MQVSKQTVLGIFIGLFLGAVFFAKAAPQAEKVPDVIRAKRFELVDDTGNKRITLSTKQGLATLTLASYDQDKKVIGTFTLGAGADGTQLVLMTNVPERTGISVQLPSKGNPELLLHGKDGKSKMIHPE